MNAIRQLSSARPWRRSSRESDESEKKDGPDTNITLVETATTTHEGQVDEVHPDADVDAFGDESHAATRYKTMEWWHVSLLMLAEIISLGVLSLPYAIATLGLFPGLFLLFFLGTIATYDGYIIGQFKLAFPNVHSFGDIGHILGGPILGAVLAFGSVLVLVFIMAAHVASFTIMMNVLTEHGGCSVIWSVVALVVSIVGGLPRTMQRTSILSVASSLSIVASVLVVMIVAGINKPDAGNVQAVTQGDLATKFVAVLNIVLSFSGHVAFPSFASELKNPHDFKKSIIMMMTFSTLFYTIVATVIYYYVGPHVKAPALSSIPLLYSKIAYGLAAPTIIVAGIVNGHVACKLSYVGFWRWKNKSVLGEKSVRSVGSWVGICVGTWVVAWTIAEVIPSFHLLLALVSALFTGWFSFGITGVMWGKLNRHNWRANGKQIALACLNYFIFFMGAVICCVGLYATGTELAKGKGGKPFTCEVTEQ